MLDILLPEAGEFPDRRDDAHPRGALCYRGHPAMGIGLFCPPLGLGYYFTTAIAKVDPDEGMKPLVGYMISLLIGFLD